MTTANYSLPMPSGSDWHSVRTGDQYTALGEALEAQFGPPPAGAKTDNYWGEADARGVRSRDVYWGDEWVDEATEVGVGITGVQHSDGRVEVKVHLHLDDDTQVELPPVGVRKLLEAIQGDEFSEALGAVLEQVAGIESDGQRGVH